MDKADFDEVIYDEVDPDADVLQKSKMNRAQSDFSRKKRRRRFVSLRSILQSIRDCPPNNIVFMHCERYHVPPEGFYTYNRLRPAIIHLSYECIKNRFANNGSYPDLFLEEEHEQLLFEQFGVRILEPATRDWRQNPDR